MKLKDLLQGRKKLREYDELKEAVEELKEVQADNGEPYDCKSHPYQLWIKRVTANARKEHLLCSRLCCKSL